MRIFTAKKHEPIAIDGDTQIVVVTIAPDRVEFGVEDPWKRPAHAEKSASDPLGPVCLLSVQEAAEYLGVAHGTVYRLVRRREITHYRIGISGGTIRFESAEAVQIAREGEKDRFGTNGVQVPERHQAA